MLRAVDGTTDLSTMPTALRAMVPVEDLRLVMTMQRRPEAGSVDDSETPPEVAGERVTVSSRPSAGTFTAGWLPLAVCANWKDTGTSSAAVLLSP
jgi:hypothetical protein